MSGETTHNIVSKATLNSEEAQAIARLRALCNTHEGLDLKLSVEQDEASEAEQPKHVLAYAGDALIGYCALDRGMPIELCGMVHPASRRQGVGRALLSAAIEECKHAGANRLVIICEEASQSGKAFMSAVRAEYRFAEHRMVLGTFQRRPAADSRLRLEQVSPQEAETLIQVRARVFNDPEESQRQSVLPDITDPHSRFYLARLGEAPVGCLKVFLQDGEAGIYGFGVLPEHRRAGFGRQMLTQIIEPLLVEQPGRITLEVETDNIAAIALYQSCGFQITTTYGYYRLRF